MPVADKDVIEAAGFAVSADQKALNRKKDAKRVELGLVRILEAHQQIVAGVNYQLELAVKVDGKENKAEVIVWWQSWRKPDPYRLTSWSWVEGK